MTATPLQRSQVKLELSASTPNVHNDGSLPTPFLTCTVYYFIQRDSFCILGGTL